MHSHKILLSSFYPRLAQINLFISWTIIMQQQFVLFYLYLKSGSSLRITAAVYIAAGSVETWRDPDKHVIFSTWPIGELFVNVFFSSLIVNKKAEQY